MVDRCRVDQDVTAYRAGHRFGNSSFTGFVLTCLATALRTFCLAIGILAALRQIVSCLVEWF